ncbi:MAG TPA: hypothetical protein VGI93_20040 [Steroidobacteraceae bacterium]|jgi:hypothetical protein
MGDEDPRDKIQTPFQKAWLDDPENLQKFWRGIERAREKARTRESGPSLNPFDHSQKSKRL